MEWDQTLQDRAQTVIDGLVKCPDVAAVALVLTWWRWVQTGGELRVEQLAHYAALRARQGRDLPGLARGRHDAMRTAAPLDWTAPDPHPDPAREAQDAEITDRFLADLTEEDRAVLGQVGGRPGRKPGWKRRDEMEERFRRM